MKKQYNNTDTYAKYTTITKVDEQKKINNNKWWKKNEILGHTFNIISRPFDINKSLNKNTIVTVCASVRRRRAAPVKWIVWMACPIHMWTDYVIFVPYFLRWRLNDRSFLIVEHNFVAKSYQGSFDEFSKYFLFVWTVLMVLKYF